MLNHKVHFVEKLSVYQCLFLKSTEHSLFKKLKKIGMICLNFPHFLLSSVEKKSERTCNRQQKMRRNKDAFRVYFFLKEKVIFKSAFSKIYLEQWWTNFSCEGPNSNYFRICMPRSLRCHYPTLPLLHESSPKGHVKEWGCLCSFVFQTLGIGFHLIFTCQEIVFLNVCFQPFRNVEITFSLQTKQKQLVGQIWPVSYS